MVAGNENDCRAKEASRQVLPEAGRSPANNRATATSPQSMPPSKLRDDNNNNNNHQHETATSKRAGNRALKRSKKTVCSVCSILCSPTNVIDRPFRLDLSNLFSPSRTESDLTYVVRLLFLGVSYPILSYPIFHHRHRPILSHHPSWPVCFWFCCCCFFSIDSNCCLYESSSPSWTGKASLMGNFSITNL